MSRSAFGGKIDHAEARLGIHHGHGKSIVDDIQEMGRAGRDGKRAECLMVYWEGFLGDTEWIDESEQE